MKKYYIKRDEDFSNIYDLVYTETPGDDAKAEADGYERIPRRETERMAKSERERRKDDPAFSGFASAWIYPYGVDADFQNRPWVQDGYLIVRGE